MTARLPGVDLREMLLAEEVAEALHVSPTTIREWARRGRLPSIRLPGSRRVLFPTAWLERYLAGDVELVVQRGPNGGRVVRPSGSAPLKAS